MKKLARAIVKMRRLILIAAVLLLIPAAVGAIATPINHVTFLPSFLTCLRSWTPAWVSCCWKRITIWPPPT